MAIGHAVLVYADPFGYAHIYADAVYVHWILSSAYNMQIEYAKSCRYAQIHAFLCHRGESEYSESDSRNYKFPFKLLLSGPKEWPFPKPIWIHIPNPEGPSQFLLRRSGTSHVCCQHELLYHVMGVDTIPFYIDVWSRTLKSMLPFWSLSKIRKIWSTNTCASIHSVGITKTFLSVLLSLLPQW